MLVLAKWMGGGPSSTANGHDTREHGLRRLALRRDHGPQLRTPYRPVYSSIFYHGCPIGNRSLVYLVQYEWASLVVVS